jgi:hypothetical protein
VATGDHEGSGQQRAPHCKHRHQVPQWHLAFCVEATTGNSCSGLLCIQGALVQSSPKTTAVWLLGTASIAASSECHTASIAIRCHNDIWLFDCGDDTQRQLLKVATSEAFSVKYLRITRIFVTSLDSAHVHGIPGMLCTLVCSICLTSMCMCCIFRQLPHARCPWHAVLPGVFDMSYEHVHVLYFSTAPTCTMSLAC